MIFMMALMLSLGKSEPKFRRASLSFSFHKSKLLDPTFTRALPIKTTELAKYLQRMSNKCRDFLQTRVLHWSLDRLAKFGQIICFDSLMFCPKITSNNDESEDDDDDVYRIARTLEVARMRMKTMPVIMMTMTMLARS